MGSLTSHQRGVSNVTSNDRLMRFLQATPAQQEAIDRILAGQMPAAAPTATGPLLMNMGPAAKFLGVSRTTLWRMIQAGKLAKVEVLPGSFRVRRAELEGLARGDVLAQGHSGAAKEVAP
jgi:excisionase family DNA binding protein